MSTNTTAIVVPYAPAQKLAEITAAIIRKPPTKRVTNKPKRKFTPQITTFDTTADIRSGYYGKWQTDHKGNKNFIKLGRAITVSEMAEDIETGEVTNSLTFPFIRSTKTLTVNREQWVEGEALIKELAKAGADVAPKNFNVIVDTLRQQEYVIQATTLWPCGSVISAG